MDEPRRGWVFVSYAHEDRARVLPIVRDLESRGVLVWWDDLLRPGDPFAAMPGPSWPTPFSILHHCDLTAWDGRRVARSTAWPPRY